MCLAAWRWWKVARPVAAFNRWFRQISDSTLLAYLHTCITECLHSCILEQLQTAYWLTCCCPPPGIQADQRLYPPCILAYLHTCILVQRKTAYLLTCCCPPPVIQADQRLYPPFILAYLHTCIIENFQTCIHAYLNSCKLHTYWPVAALHRWFRQIRDSTSMHTCILA